MISLYLDDVVIEFYVLLSPDSSLFYLKVLDCLYIYSFILVSAYWLLFRLTEAWPFRFFERCLTVMKENCEPRSLKHGTSQQEWFLSKKFWGAHSGNQNLTPILFLPWSWKWKTTIIEMYWKVTTIGGTHSMIMGGSVESFKEKVKPIPVSQSRLLKPEYFPWHCWWTLVFQNPPNTFWVGSWTP